MKMKKALYLFGQMSDMDTDWLSKVGKKKQLAPGAILIREGQQIAALYIILAGTLLVSTGQKKRELDRLDAGEVVGEMSFVDSRPPSATVSAIAEVIVLEIDRDQLQERLNRDTRFAAQFYRALAMFLSDKMRDTIGMLGYADPGGSAGKTDDGDYLDDNVMDTVYLAGLRFERMVKQVMGEKK
jgi:CRP-like cAMP-binding protein